MTLYCSVCGKRVVSYMGMPQHVIDALVARDSKGNPIHKVCMDGAMKNAFNKSQNLPVQMWQANDPQVMSGTELGRLRRVGKYGRL